MDKNHGQTLEARFQKELRNLVRASSVPGPQRSSSWAVLRQLLLDQDNQAYFRSSYGSYDRALEQAFEGKSHKGSPGSKIAELQGLLASTLRVPKQLNDYFKGNLDQLDDANIPVEQRILALINLTACVEVLPFERLRVPALVVELLNRLMLSFEKITEEQVLVQAVRLLEVLARTNEAAFAPHFQNLIDIILGWALDANTKPDVRDAITGLMARFEGQWGRHNTLATDLLDKFVMHLQHFAGNTHLLTAASEGEDNNKIVIGLIGCFTSILSMLPPEASADESSSLQGRVGLQADLATRLFSCFFELSPCVRVPGWTTKVGACIEILAKVMGATFGPHFSSAFDVLRRLPLSTGMQARDVAIKRCRGEQLTFLLRVYTEMVRHAGRRLPVEASRLLSWDLYQACRSHSNVGIVHAALGAVQALVQSEAECQGLGYVGDLATQRIINELFLLVDTLQPSKVDGQANTNKDAALDPSMDGDVVLAFVPSCAAAGALIGFNFQVLASLFHSAKHYKGLGAATASLQNKASIVTTGVSTMLGDLAVSTSALAMDSRLRLLAMELLSVAWPSVSTEAHARQGSFASQLDFLLPVLVQASKQTHLHLHQASVKVLSGGSTDSRLVVLALRWLQRLLGVRINEREERNSATLQPRTLTHVTQMLCTHPVTQVRLQVGKFIPTLAKWMLPLLAHSSYASEVRTLLSALAHSCLHRLADAQVVVRAIFGHALGYVGVWVQGNRTLYEMDGNVEVASRSRTASIARDSLEEGEEDREAERDGSDQEEEQQAQEETEEAEAANAEEAREAGRVDKASTGSAPTKGHSYHDPRYLEDSSMRHSLLRMPQLPSFLVQHFTRALNDISQSITHSDDYDWAEALMHTTAEKLENGEVVEQEEKVRGLASIDRCFRLEWILGNAVKYLIRSNLKSHAGGPLQTLQLIERMLVGLAPANDVRPAPSDAGVLGGRVDEGTQWVTSVFRARAPLRQLLFTVDLLERFITNAATTSLYLPRPDKINTVFYKANAKTCSTFFNRIRLKLVHASAVCGTAADVINNAFKYILESGMEQWHCEVAPAQDLRGHPPLSFSVEVDTVPLLQLQEVIYLACQACVKLHDFERLQGMRLWAADYYLSPESKQPSMLTSSASSRCLLALLPWLPAMALQAEGRYEDAIRSFKDVFRARLSNATENGQKPTSDAVSPTPTPSDRPAEHSMLSMLSMTLVDVRAVVTGVSECYMALGDWMAMEVWTKELDLLRAGHAYSLFYLHKSSKSLAGPAFASPFDASHVKGLQILDSVVSFPTSDASSSLSSARECLLGSLGASLVPVPTPVSAAGAPTKLLPRYIVQAQDSSQQVNFANVLQESRKCFLLGMVDMLLLSDSQPASGPEKAQQVQASELSSWNAFDLSEHWASDTLQLCAPGSLAPAERVSVLLELQTRTALRSHDLELIVGLHEARHETAGDRNHLLLAHKCLRRMMCKDLADKEGHTSSALLSTLHLGQLRCSSSARRQGNFDMARRLLTQLQGQRLAPAVSFELQYEAALLRGDGSQDKALVFRDLHVLHDKLQTFTASTAEPHAGLKQLHAQCVRKMSKLIGNFGDLTSFQAIDYTTLSDRRSLAMLPHSPISRSQEYCLRTATDLTHTSARAWFDYGSWFFEHAKSTAAQAMDTDIDAGRVLEIARSLPEDVRGDEAAVAKSLYTIVCSVATTELKRRNARREEQAEEGWQLDTFQVLPDDLSWTLRTLVAQRIRDLLGGRSHAIDLEATLDSLTRLAAARAFRLLSYHECTVQSYFKVLSSEYVGFDSREHKSHVVYSNTAPLVLLKLLVEYGSDLRKAFHRGIMSTPPAAWKQIIPQLMARMCHSSAVVRHLIRLVLARLGAAEPDRLVFPLVVGLQSAKKQLFHFKHSQLSELASEITRKSSMSASSSAPPLASSTLTPFVDSMGRVGSLIQELNRVANLWEDQWLFALRSVASDLPGRLQILERELGDDTGGLLPAVSAAQEARYRLVMDPVIEQIRSLYERTCEGHPGTPHEVAFQRSYSTQLSKLIDSFEHDTPFTREKLARLHAVTKSPIFLELKSAFARLSSIRMAEVSPYLNQWDCDSLESGICLVGMGPEGSAAIQAFAPQLHVLRTKTRPKKLSLVGTDGSHYSYLLKSREDLHLDERMMQFISLTNDCLAKSSSRADSTRYRASTFPIIPLSDQSGLIFWVGSVTPLFDMYKAWQREAKTLDSKLADLYRRKVVEYLKLENLAASTPMKLWPHALQLRVFQEMSALIPRDLIARELWLTSVAPVDWWEKQRTFAVSAAVMSMVGYTLGLGDRHLGNILANFKTGELLHIDYNICFDRGLRLPCPEIVPFRLTQTIANCFGLGGVQGIFAHACRSTMKVLRKHSLPLTSLLASFVFDPLVDWLPAEHKNDRKAIMDQRMGLGLLQLRLRQYRQSMVSTMLQFNDLLPLLDSYLARLHDITVTTHRDSTSGEVLTGQELSIAQGKYLLASTKAQASLTGTRTEELKVTSQELFVKHQACQNQELQAAEQAQAMLSQCQDLVRRHGQIKSLIADCPSLLAKLAVSWSGNQVVEVDATLADIFSRSVEIGTNYERSFFLQNVSNALPSVPPLRVQSFATAEGLVSLKGLTSFEVCGELDNRLSIASRQLKERAYEVLKLLTYFKQMTASSQGSDSSIEAYTKSSVAHIWGSKLGEQLRKDISDLDGTEEQSEEWLLPAHSDSKGAFRELEHLTAEVVKHEKDLHKALRTLHSTITQPHFLAAQSSTSPEEVLEWEEWEEATAYAVLMDSITERSASEAQIGIVLAAHLTAAKTSQDCYYRFLDNQLVNIPRSQKKSNSMECAANLALLLTVATLAHQISASPPGAPEVHNGRTTTNPTLGEGGVEELQTLLMQVESLAELFSSSHFKLSSMRTAPKQANLHPDSARLYATPALLDCFTLLHSSSRLTESVCSEVPVLLNQLHFLSSAPMSSRDVQQPIARSERLENMKHTVDLLKSLAHRAGLAVDGLQKLVAEEEQDPMAAEDDASQISTKGAWSTGGGQKPNFLQLLQRKERGTARQIARVELHAEVQDIYVRYYSLKTQDSVTDTHRNLAHGSIPEQEEMGSYAMRASLSILDSLWLQLEAHEHTLQTKLQVGSKAPDELTRTKNDALHLRLFFANKLQSVHLILDNILGAITTSPAESFTMELQNQTVQRVRRVMELGFVQPLTHLLLAPTTAQTLVFTVQDQLDPALRPLASSLYAGLSDSWARVLPSTVVLLVEEVVLSCTGETAAVYESQPIVKALYDDILRVRKARLGYERNLEQSKIKAREAHLSLQHARLLLAREYWSSSSQNGHVDNESDWQLTYRLPRASRVGSKETGLIVNAPAKYGRQHFLLELDKRTKALADARFYLETLHSENFVKVEDTLLASLQKWVAYDQSPPLLQKADQIYAEVGKRRSMLQGQLQQTAQMLEAGARVMQLELLRESPMQKDRAAPGESLQAAVPRRRSDGPSAYTAESGQPVLHQQHSLHLHSSCEDASVALQTARTERFNVVQEVASVRKDLQFTTEANASALEIVSTLSKTLEVEPQSLSETRELARELRKQITANVDSLKELIAALVPKLDAVLNQDVVTFKATRPTLAIVGKSSTSIGRLASGIKSNYEKQHANLGVLVASPTAKTWETMGRPRLANTSRRMLQDLQSLKENIDLALKGLETPAVGDRREEKNPYAVNVLKRAKAKLDGFEGESYESSSKGRPQQNALSVSDHVQWLIREATSEDTLCRMYDGWTPWV